MTITREFDEESIERIERACFSEPWSAALIKEQLSGELSVTGALLEAGEIVGYYTGVCGLDVFELYRIAVLPEYRGKGYGRILLSEFTKECLSRLNEQEAFFLEVRSGNAPARRLYESFGYCVLSVRKRYYGNEDAVIYRMSIKNHE